MIFFYFILKEQHFYKSFEHMFLRCNFGDLFCNRVVSH